VAGRCAVVLLALVGAVAFAAPAARADTPTRPSIDDLDAPDPHVVVAPDGGYRAYSTQIGMLNVPARRSTDLASWSQPWDAMPTLPPWAEWGRTWAPGVIGWPNGAWHLYFTARHAESDRQCIGVATAANPDGPFAPGPEPLVCQLDLGGSIDAYPYRDPATGTHYLYWKSDENAVGSPTSTLWGAVLTADGLGLEGALPLLRRDQAWELPTVEQPAMVVAGGRWWLVYAANAWESDRYASGFAACAGPLGPCSKVTTAGPWMVGGGFSAGPGGVAFFTGTDGVLRAAWHGWRPGNVGYPALGRRAMHVEPVTFDDVGPHLLRLATAPFAHPVQAVETAYRDVLVRPPDPAGLWFWVSRINAGVDTAASTFAYLAASDEFGGVGAPNVRLYEGYFDRLPDPAGLRYWMGVARQRGLGFVSAAFAASPEFAATYGALDNAAFVDRVYRNVLGRGADRDGQAYWIFLLARGLTRGELMLAFTESPEHRAATEAEAEVVMLYVGMLGRLPDPGGYTYWSAVRRSGQPLAGLVAGILASSEYRLLHRLP
jgi:Glycosyl hydrolases family 43/Domain of unknown function (DUF4214)